MIWEEPPRLLSDQEVEEIRRGVREGLRGPVLLGWVAKLLADHDERVRLRQAKSPTGE